MKTQKGHSGILAGEEGQGTPLRYGENPHQRATLHLHPNAPPGAAAARQLQGAPLGYNNLLDADAAFRLVSEYPPTAAAAFAIVKHGVPCGAAARPTPAAAYTAARACDPTSAYGGVAASNRPLDADAAETLAAHFLELVIAPHIETPAAALLHERRPSLRLLETGGLPDIDPTRPPTESRSIAGGVLVQEQDTRGWDASRHRQASRRPPSERETADLRFAFLLCKHVKSNAIVLARDQAAVGIGGGQVSRVDAVAQAIAKAQAADGGASGAVLASDGFFPFADGIRLAAEAGVSAVVQPGGSKRDAETIAAADAHDMAMLFTDTRQFRH